MHESTNETSGYGCPRSALDRCLRIAETRHHLSLRAGFEVEFVLIDPLLSSHEPVPNVHVWSSAASLRNKYHRIVEDMVSTLQRSGIGLEQYHTEGAQGTFEIVTKAESPMKAVDSLLRIQETIRAISARENLMTSMFARPTTRPNTPGQHIHLSISPTECEESFLAGILDNLSAICALTMPTIDSYVRVKDLGGTTGSWISWAYQMRDVPLRKVGPGHWEYRPADETANMYLALSAIIGCGLWGVKQKVPLSWKDPVLPPCKLDQKTRASLGITRQMPQSLEEALDELMKGKLMVGILDKELVSRFLNAKIGEEILASNMSEDERRERSILLF